LPSTRAGSKRSSDEKGENVTIEDMLDHHPRGIAFERDVLLRCIEAYLDCASTCTSCADESLGETDVDQMIRSIRLCLDCADICDSAARIVTRQTEVDRGVVRAAIEACAAICRACADECERHAAHHEHCRICAEVCRRCAQACDDLVATIG
jgi:uncharacterized membrane protein